MHSLDHLNGKLMCSSRKYPYPPQGRLTEIPRGRGFQKANFFKESMTLKWNFRLGGGVQAKIPSVGGVCINYFLEQHNILSASLTR